MEHFMHFRVLLLLSFGSILWMEGEASEHHDKPNFLLIMADDLGIGDVGCFGNTTIRTPHIDQLAQDGVKLTHHISAAPLCSPSRTAFMTGRYPIRSGMASIGRAPVLLWTAGSGGLPPNEITFAKVLQEKGYSTGIVGKWHLGVNCNSRDDLCHHPNNHGFDYFYGMPFTLFSECKEGHGRIILPDVRIFIWRISEIIGLAILTAVSLRLLGLLFLNCKFILLLVLAYILCISAWYLPFQFINIWNCIIMRNGEVVEQPMALETLPLRLLNEAEGFLQRNKDKPFLLFVSFPHVHSPLFESERFKGKSKHGLYGDNIEEMDWMTGRIVKMVEDLGLSKKTFVYFTSDHGGHVEHADSSGQVGGWNGIYKGGKGMAGWDGGIRVPGIIRWPGKLPAGKVIDKPTSLMDIFPTVVNIANGQLPTDRSIDGHDLLPLIQGEVPHSRHEFMFHYCGVDIHAVRWHPRNNSDSVYKVHFFTPNFNPPGAIGCYNIMICRCYGEFVSRHDPPLVFDISRDPSESLPLSPEVEPRYSEILQRVQEVMEEHQKAVKPVPSQFTVSEIMWKPWLQPCCGTFPFCSCKESNGS
ncbi:ARSD Arylsulfatase, partial [Polypterus senegalus]|nr:arylsulfatase D isoform X1 [Polypterus senegalus]XP_039599501.1 arylsulfatase D isoform X1 [Polypterus senegalus]XP_039599502.1 arylsulfatase D isoform X1 [Polypterus senegalus]MBN3294387.1 ARSD Arylsulfatase [Polypterus senegalus]